MHAQKGTAGAIYPEEMMPFLKRLGYSPNILLNPLAFPSRMTIGMFLESLLGTSLASSALKCPEYNLPLCLDGDPRFTQVEGEARDTSRSERRPKGGEESRSCCITTDVDSSLLSYPEDFDPNKDYKFGLNGGCKSF